MLSSAASTIGDDAAATVLPTPPDLTCPISLEYFEDPVLTPCCGNTLSRASLRLAMPKCPLCRTAIDAAHPGYSVEDAPINRTVKNLVEAHRSAHGIVQPAVSAKDGCTTGNASRGAAPAIKPKPLPAAESNSAHACGVCAAVDARFRCSACRVVYYCSAECQHSGWAAHKAACKRSVANARAHRMTREADEQAAAIATARAAAGSGGLSAAWREDLSAIDVTDSAAQPSGDQMAGAAPSDDGAGGGSSNGSTTLLDSISAGMREEKLYAFADPPTYDRLVLSTACGKDRYQAHVVEAGLTPEGGGKGSKGSKGCDESTASGGASGGASGLSARWTMMDYSLSDLKRQGLNPIGEAELRTHYARPLREMERCRRCGDAARYQVRADPAVLGGPEGEGAHALVEQMVAESEELACLLGEEAKVRFGAARPPPDSHAVAKALEQLKGMGIGMGRKPA